MVFVTVGNALHGFRRLLDAVDAANGRGEIDAGEVIIQSGHNPDFQPRYCTAIPFMPNEQFNDLMEKADLIICHGGCTQLQAVRLGKVPVVMPRRKKYNEIVNDHQLQLTRVLAAEGKVIVASEPEDLREAIKQAKLRQRDNVFVPSPMLELVAQAIDDLVNAPRRTKLRARLTAFLLGRGKGNVPSP